jgi:hypothetical protein
VNTYQAELLFDHGQCETCGRLASPIVAVRNRGYFCEDCYWSKHKTTAERAVPLLATPRCNTRYCGHRYDDHDYTLKSCKIDECACCRWDGPEPDIETGRFPTERVSLERGVEAAVRDGSFYAIVPTAYINVTFDGDDEPTRVPIYQSHSTITFKNNETETKDWSSSSDDDRWDSYW